MTSVAELPYRVEVWDDADAHVEELVALCGDHAVASALPLRCRRRHER